MDVIGAAARRTRHVGYRRPAGARAALLPGGAFSMASGGSPPTAMARACCAGKVSQTRSPSTILTLRSGMVW